MIDLAAEYMETVKRILAEHIPECEVRAFGSRVTGTAKSYSDLDLAVIGQHAIEPTRLSRLIEAFQESDLPFRVDVLDWHRISEGFRGVINAGYLILVEGRTE